MKEKFPEEEPRRDSLADPEQHPFSETHDYYERQARYRMLVYRARSNVQHVLEQPDALDDPLTRARLRELRDEIANLDLPEKSPTDELSPKKNNRHHLQREDGYGVNSDNNNPMN